MSTLLDQIRQATSRGSGRPDRNMDDDTEFNRDEYNERAYERDRDSQLPSENSRSTFPL